MTEATIIVPEESREEPVARAAPKAARLVTYSAYGVGVAIQTTVELLEWLPSPLIPASAMKSSETGQRVAFEFCEIESADGRRLFIVATNGAVVFSSPDVQIAAYALESRVHLEVAALTEQAVFVHAGVVGWRGKALAIPGRSHSGKSTLVAALVAAGATYYSDEYAVIDLEGIVHAFPRRLRLRGNLAQDAVNVSVSDCASKAPLPPLQLGWVLNTRYAAAVACEPRRLTPGQTLLSLLGNTVAVRRQSELTVRTLSLAVASATGWQSERAEAASAAEEIVRLISETSDAGTA